MGYLKDKWVVESMAEGDKVFVNSGDKIRQISLKNLNKSLDILNEKELMQVAFYTDFDEDGSTILKQGGNLGIIDYVFSRGGNYLMKPNGYAAKLNPNDPTRFTDGTPAPLDDSKGYEMTLLPDFYYLVETRANGKPRIWVSLKDIGGKYQPAQWMGTHKMFVANGLGRSRSGVVPTGGLTISEFTNAAKANGSDWNLANYTMRKTLALMFYLRYGNTYSQGASSILGEGMSGVGSSYENCRNIPTGKANVLGDGTGYVDVADAAGATVGSVSVFGVKDPFGQIWEFCGGIIGVGDKFYISDDNVTPVDGVPSWPNMRTQTRNQDGSGSYITKMQWGAYADMLPKEAVGSSTTFYSDGWWSNPVGRMLLCGGSAYYEALCGLVCAHMIHVLSYASVSVGARLGFYGTAKIVPGAKLVSM